MKWVSAANALYKSIAVYQFGNGGLKLIDELNDLGVKNLATAIVFKAVCDYKETVFDYVKDKKQKPILIKDQERLGAEYKRLHRIAKLYPTAENKKLEKDALKAFSRANALLAHVYLRERKIKEAVEFLNSDWCYELGYDGKYLLKSLIANGYDYTLY